MRREAEQAEQAEEASEHYSVRELLVQLGSIQETVLIYPSTGVHPNARGMLIEEIDTHASLADIFDLKRWAPKKS